MHDGVSGSGVEMKSLFFLLRPSSLGDLVKVLIEWNVVAHLHNVLHINMTGLKECYHSFLPIIIFDTFKEW